MYRQSEIQKLIDNLDIVQVISEYVDLKKAGANYKGFSPFKSERTPSFVVSPVKNIFTDFSSQISGNVISFYMRINDLGFVEAVRELSRKYNIELKEEKTSSERTEKYGKYYEIMKEAQLFYSEKILTSGEALDYMKKRNFTLEDIKKYNIGFSLNSWDGLLNHLLEKGYGEKELLDLGLISESERNGFFDYFRNRIMFPIYNSFGNVIAFGGRKIDENNDSPKYLNSKESLIFKKGRELFGLENRGENVKKRGYAILMEGYMDVLSSKKNGFTSSVASLGTAFTDEQAELLKKYTKNVVIAYDNDEAGRNAVKKAGLILKKKDFTIKCLVLDNDIKDPDEYLKTYGKKQFFEQLKLSVPFFDYIYGENSRNLDLQEISSKLEFIEKFKDFFAVLKDETEVYLYASKLAVDLEIDVEVLYKKVLNYFKSGKTDYRKYRNRNYSKNYESYTENYIKTDTGEKKYDPFERNMLKVILKSRNRKAEGSQYFEFLKEKEFKNEFYNGIVEKLKKIDFDISKADENLFDEAEKREIVLLNDFEEIRENYEMDVCLQWLKQKTDLIIKNLTPENKRLHLIKLKKIQTKLKEERYNEFKEIVQINEEIESLHL